MDNDRLRRTQDRENLRNLITQWNANRLDLFELSEPNEDLEFHGVMRFYFQDAGQKVATKCIRVSSTATAKVVIYTLIEKFRPDLKMLSFPDYALYEIHENGDERQLDDDEKPLLVQLNWHRDDREGRFLLRRMDEKTYMTPQHFEDSSNFKRKLSKREKKEKKKKEKLLRIKISEENDKHGLAEKLYTEIPETSFTRSISNPEAVMRRRRQQKLGKKLQQFRSKDGGPDTGGTLKIYGESLCKDVPYKTLLLSVRDNAAFVVKEMLDKYGLDKEDPPSYCLVQSISDGDSEYHGSGNSQEYILDDDECPLAILMNHSPAKGSVMFHIRRRPADYQPRKRKKKPKPTRADADGSYIGENGYVDRLPFFIELNPDSSDVVSSPPRRFILHLNVTEVGSERGSSQGGQYLQLFGPNVQAHHCVVAHTEGIVTVTPCSREAETYVNGQRIYETTILLHGAVVRFGKIHCFRFIDPLQDDRRRHDLTLRSGADISERQSARDDLSLHPSFDNDGNVETISTSSQKDDRRSEKSDRSRDGRIATYESEPRRGRDPILPAVLEVWEEAEDAFLEYLVARLDPSDVHFKLAPTYTLYMTSRFRASTHYRPEVTPMERAHRLTAFLGTVATLIQHTIEERDMDAGSLAFWMANSSELLHFLKQDRHLNAFCLDAQDILAESVQAAFRFLVQCMQMELLDAMPAFLEDCDDLAEEEGTSGKVLGVLSATMALLRRCRVNAALTIQLFSQLFHFVNMWLFNKVLTSSRPNYCTRLWGVRLKGRLTRVENWAEKQGLELAADCHLGRIAQAAHLLQSPKSSPDDLSAISSTCIKLNSLQLQALLERYQPAAGEPRIPRDLVENVVKVAENAADEMVRADGRDVRLEEDADLQLPFLLPEDGYSCDIVRGLPGGLQEFLHPLQQAGLCRVLVQPTSCGYWTVYMAESDHVLNRDEPRVPGPMNPHGDADSRTGGMASEPEVAIMKLQKSNNGMGLSIVAAKGIGQEKLGIYIKSVVKGGAADQDGRLQAGDQLLRVDGHSLVGITQEKAAEILTRTGPVVILEIAKQGALYHGLATLLSQPSPVMYRGAGYPGPRRLSERDIHSRFLREDSADSDPRLAPRMQSSKSVPSLNSGGGGGNGGSGNAASQELLLPLWAGNAKSPQEVYNPAYSRTSPAAAVGRTGPDVPPHGEAPAMKSKSTNNLRHDNNAQFGDQGSRGRPLSQPNLHQEERHYQNISMYQQHQQQQQQQQQQPPGTGQPRSNVGFGQPEDRVSQRVPRPPLQPQPSQRPTGTMPKDQQMAMQNSRQHQQAGPGWGHPHDDQQRQFAGPAALHQQQQQMQMQMPQHYPGKFPDGYAYQFGGEQRPDNLRQTHGSVPELQRSPEPPRVVAQNATATMGRIRPGQQDAWRNERDVLRQEAKMDEMREEVRRREERLQKERLIAEQRQHQLQQNQQRWADPRSETRNQPRPGPPYPSYAARPTGAPPPTAPKPRPGQQGQLPPQRPPPPFTDGRVVHDGPALLDDNHRNSPQPPPPPPTSTHPLFQQMQMVGPAGQGPTSPNGQVRDNRYASQNFSGRPQQQDQMDRRILEHAKSFGHHLEGIGSPLSPSPWEREEREKEKKRRLDDARRFRDKEIDDLENLGGQRTTKQEERLRTLRLEQEFQRRAEELKNDDDDDNEEDDDVVDRRGLLRMMQENLERSRMKRVERDNERIQSQQIQDTNRIDKQERRIQGQDQDDPNKGAVRRDQQPQQVSSDEWLRKQQEVRSQRREQQAREEEQQRIQQRERQQKFEEVQRKKEQEKAAMRELRLAREAEERILREAQRRQEEEARAQRVLAQQQQQHYYGGYMSGNNNYQMQPTANRGSENGPTSAPAPPERKASYEVMAGMDSTAATVPATKRVSFHDTKFEAFEPATTPTSNNVTNASPFLATPHNSQNLATFTAGSTPGVIGAQEIYRDPRHRIEANRSQAVPGRQPGPEKLSFREKMKMFALETGENESPRDKMKISKAQREIETNLTPAAASARS